MVGDSRLLIAGQLSTKYDNGGESLLSSTNEYGGKSLLSRTYDYGRKWVGDIEVVGTKKIFLLVKMG